MFVQMSSILVQTACSTYRYDRWHGTISINKNGRIPRRKHTHVEYISYRTSSERIISNDVRENVIQTKYIEKMMSDSYRVWSIAVHEYNRLVSTTTTKRSYPLLYESGRIAYVPCRIWWKFVRFSPMSNLAYVCVSSLNVANTCA
jgi:hypothetical protein